IFQPRTIEEGKEVGSLVIEMVPEPAVGRIPARVVQHAIELDFQTSRRGQQSVQGDLLVLVALGQGQGLLEHLLHPQREACGARGDRKSTRLNSSHVAISYAGFCLKKKNCADGAGPNDDYPNTRHRGNSQWR